MPTKTDVLWGKQYDYREQLLLSLEGHDLRANDGCTGVQRHHIAHNWRGLPLVGHHACNLNDWVLVWLWKATLNSSMAISSKQSAIRRCRNAQSIVLLAWASTV